jgi:hypothetical protein
MISLQFYIVISLYQMVSLMFVLIKFTEYLIIDGGLFGSSHVHI